jgi:hypothetical protein
VGDGEDEVEVVSMIEEAEGWSSGFCCWGWDCWKVGLVDDEGIV